MTPLNLFLLLFSAFLLVYPIAGDPCIACRNQAGYSVCEKVGSSVPEDKFNASDPNNLPCICPINTSESTNQVLSVYIEQLRNCITGTTTGQKPKCNGTTVLDEEEDWVTQSCETYWRGLAAHASTSSTRSASKTQSGTSSASSSAPARTASSFSDSNSTRVIVLGVGITVGCCALIGGAVAVFLIRRRKKRREEMPIQLPQYRELIKPELDAAESHEPTEKSNMSQYVGGEKTRFSEIGGGDVVEAPGTGHEPVEVQGSEPVRHEIG